MPILRVQHSVPRFEIWKRTFDRDPLDRRRSGVRRYQIYRSLTDPHYVMVDLEFDALEPAQSFLERLEELWSGPGKAVVREPQGRVFEAIESAELERAAE